MRLETWRYFDFWLLGAVAILIIFGIAMIDSAIAGNPELIENNAIERQIIFAAIGFVVVFGVTLFDYHFWATIGRVLYGVIFIMLAMVTFGGEEAFGAGRWLTVAGQVIQPSEMAKITVIVLASDFFARNQERIGEIPIIIRGALATVVLVGLIIVQPISAAKLNPL